MPVQIPQLKRIGPSAPESVGRIDVDLPDGTKAVAQTAGAIENLAQKGLNYAYDLEDQAIDLTATKAASDYEVKYKTELQKAKSIEGDPTDAYTRFDQDSNTWRDEILKNYEGADERTKRKILEKIDRTNLTLRDQRAVSEQLQYATYEKKTTEDAINLRKEGVLGAIELADVKDPDTFLSLEVQLDEIRKLRIDSGRRNRLLTTDEQGNERLTPQLAMQIRKDTSEALENAITTLNASGKTEEAAYLMEKYKDDILADTKTKLVKGNKDSEVKNQALLAVDQVKFMDPEAAMAKLTKIANLEVREKSLEILDAQQRRIQNAKDRAAKETYENLADYVSSKGFVSLAEMKDDETYKRLEGRLKQSQRAALEKLVAAPKNSDEAVKAKVYDLSLGGHFQGMNYADFLHATAGLNQKDRAAFERKWKSDNETTGVEQSKMVSYMGKQLENQLYGAGYLKKDFGKWTPKSDKKRVQAYDEMMIAIESFPPGTSVVEQQKWVREFVAKKIKGEAFTGMSDQPQKFQSAPPPKREAPKTPAKTETSEMTFEEKKAWVVKWQKANPGRIFDPRKKADIEAVAAFAKANKDKQ